MCKVNNTTKWETNTTKAKSILPSTGLKATTSVRRPLSRDSPSKNSDLSNTNNSSGEVEVSIRTNKKTYVASKNVVSGKMIVTDVDAKNALKAINIFYVSCSKNLLIPCHDKCLVNYKLNVHSKVRRALYTTPRSKTVDTTPIVLKTRVKEKDLNRNKKNTSSVIGVSKDSDDTINDDTPVDVTSAVQEGITPSVVDMTVEIGKQYFLDDTTVLESFPPLSTPITNTADNASGKKVACPVVANYVRNTWGFKPQKEYRPVPKKPNASSSGNKKKGVKPTIKVSNSNPFNVLNSVDNDVEFGTNEETTNLVNNEATLSGFSSMNIDNEWKFSSNTPISVKIDKIEQQIFEGKLRLLDNDENPLVPTGIMESDSKMVVVYDETANLRISTSGKDESDKGYGTNSLLEQWRDSYPDNDDYDPNDDDMYENHDLSKHLQSICDDLDITVCGRKKK
nr:hypothetical protein [Tanacetum cinerariifolium]